MPSRQQLNNGHTLRRRHLQHWRQCRGLRRVPPGHGECLCRWCAFSHVHQLWTPDVRATGLACMPPVLERTVRDRKWCARNALGGGGGGDGCVGGGGWGVGGDDVSGSHRACTRSGRPCPARAGNRKRHCGVDRPRRQNFANAARRVDGGGRESAGGPRRRARGGHGGQRLHARSSARGQCDAERCSARPGARLR